MSNQTLAAPEVKPRLVHTGPLRTIAPDRVDFDLVIMVPIRVTGSFEMWSEKGEPNSPGFNWSLDRAQLLVCDKVKPVNVPHDCNLFAEIEGSDELEQFAAKHAER